jgi:hypothetical protein
MRSLGLRVGIIAVFLVGGFLIQQYVSKNAGDLAVGDCFDLPETASGIIEDVDPNPCTDPHDAEVVFVGDYEPATDAYPSESELTDYETDKCIAAFNNYTGIDFNTDELYTMGTIEPTAEGWDNGDHEITCYLARLDGTKLTTSIKKS